MTTNTPIYDRLVDNLKDYRRRKKFWLFFDALGRWLFWVIPIGFLILLIEGFFHSTPTGRIFWVGFFVLISVFFLVRFVFNPFLALFLPKTPELDAVAREVGKHYRQVDDRLVNALQLYQKRTENPENYSLALIEASLQSVGERLKSESFRDHFDCRPIKRRLQRTALLLLSTLVPFFIATDWFLSASNRLIHPGRDDSSPKALIWLVEPGDYTVIKGEDLSVLAWLPDPGLKTIELHEHRQFRSKTFELNRCADDTFRHTFTGILDTLRYRFAVQDHKSQMFTVRVLDYPMLRRLQVKIIPPAYTRMEPILLPENLGDVTALEGSRVKISGSANKDLQSALISFSNHQKNAHVSAKQIEAEFIVEKDDRYELILQDTDHLQSRDPIVYPINCLVDQPPLVRITDPGHDIDLQEDLKISISIEAEDDYGFSRFRLATQVQRAGLAEAEEGFAFTDLSDVPQGTREVVHGFVLDATPFELFPKDVLLYYVEVYDNDVISGPKAARSAIHRARFPSIYELYEQISRGNENLFEQMSDLDLHARDLQQRMEDLTLELQRQGEQLDWQKRQQIDEVMTEQERLHDKLKESLQSMQSLREEMATNSLVSEETLEKYRRLNELMQDFLTPDLLEAMKKLGESMNAPNPEAVRQALEKLRLQETDLQRELERAIALLENVQLERKLDQALTLAETARMQQEAVEKRALSDPGDPPKLQREQATIAETAEQLQDVLQDLDRELGNRQSPAQDEVHQAVEEMQTTHLQQKYEEMQQQLAQQNMSSFQQNSQQARASLSKIAENIAAAKNKIKTQARQDNLRALQKSAQDVLHLSHQQESLLIETQKTPVQAAEISDLAARQNDLSAALERVLQSIYDESKKELALDPRVYREMNRSQQEMQKALRSLAERQTGTAAGQQS
ncbi:DUF4175 family protein, partial [candidate division KSB1 bacterium]|nr:DUF4175 family protein [candidate division KSB1 bacterium]